MKNHLCGNGVCLPPQYLSPKWGIWKCWTLLTYSRCKVMFIHSSFIPPSFWNQPIGYLGWAMRHHKYLIKSCFFWCIDSDPMSFKNILSHTMKPLILWSNLSHNSPSGILNSPRPRLGFALNVSNNRDSASKLQSFQLDLCRVFSISFKNSCLSRRPVACHQIISPWKSAPLLVLILMKLA